MKIYFTGSATGRSEGESVYREIVNHLVENHEVFHSVLTGHTPNLPEMSGYDIENWYKEWKIYVDSCDVAVVEGTYPSTIHVGFEISQLLVRKRPVILLYKEDKNPVYISSLFSSRLIKSSYTVENISEVLDWALKEASSLSLPRFTFYISPRIDEFLDKVAFDKGFSKSEYIRALIEKEIHFSQKPSRGAKLKGSS